MKKKVFKIMFFLFMIIGPSGQMMAQTANPVGLNSTYIDPTSTLSHPHKSPMQVPSIFLEEYHLYFNTPCDGYELRLVDSCGDVVYSLVIPSGTAYLLLPESLQGEYELQLVSGNKMFYGTIEL